MQTLRMRLFQSLLVLWGGKRCIALTPTIWEPSTVSKENRYVSNCQYVNVCTRQIGQLGHVELQTPSDTVCLMFNSSSISMACTVRAQPDTASIASLCIDHTDLTSCLCCSYHCCCMNMGDSIPKPEQVNCTRKESLRLVHSVRCKSTSKDTFKNCWQPAVSAT